MENDLLNRAINLCITKGIPFVAYQLPNTHNISFFANPSKLTDNQCKSDEVFRIGFFNKTINNVEIHNEIGYKELLSNIDNFAQSKSFITPHKSSTDYNSYCSQVTTLTDSLAKTQGKVVLSKVVCGTHNITDFSDVANKYFSAYNNSFRYIYYTAETGCWIGASPEVLLKYSDKSHTLETMSLAGTRLVTNESQEWDNKNIEEHNYVTKFICDTLTELGLQHDVSPLENLQFGTIEHLCNHIIIHVHNSINNMMIVNALSPTPALSGYPVDEAISCINSLENHSRHCYGGHITLETPTQFLSHVNLRCAHFDAQNFCIYSGGGITKDSNPSDEWIETENKIKILKQIFS